MTSITLVTESKLYLKDNSSLYDYFDDYSKLFNFLVRRCVHHLKNKLNGESESCYRTNLMFEFNITNRMAKAVIKTAKNQLKLLKESAKYQYNNLYKRKRSLFKKITNKSFLRKEIIKLFTLGIKMRNMGINSFKSISTLSTIDLNTN